MAISDIDIERELKHLPLETTTLLGKANINIANFNLGREKAGGDAICLIEVDADLPAGVLEEIKALPHVVQVKALSFWGFSFENRGMAGLVPAIFILDRVILS